MTAGARRAPEETQGTTPVQIVQVPVPTLPPFPTVVTLPRPVVPTTALPRVTPTTVPVFTLPTTTTVPLGQYPFP
jgi:hypothetical protein